MSAITIDMAINFTKELKILYVEDDMELQAQTKEFFEVLFKKTSVASDGKEALEMYKEESYDIVISDVKMPKMDGIELSTKIREIHPNQCIIIVSAYNDSNYLLKFINMNIRYFMQKPIEIDNMLETLYYTAKSIVNEKMVEEYRADLEQSNKELHTKNKELESLVRILDSKLVQIGQSKKVTIKKDDLEHAKLETADLNELKELEIDISGAAVLINLSKNITTSNIQVLGDLFLSYAKIIASYKIYEELSTSILSLGNTLNEAPQNFIDRVSDIATLLESFIYVLRIWRGKVESEEFQSAIEFHSSMINDLSTIIAIVSGTENDIESEMEFF